MNHLLEKLLLDAQSYDGVNKAQRLALSDTRMNIILLLKTTRGMLTLSHRLGLCINSCWFPEPKMIKIEHLHKQISGFI